MVNGFDLTTIPWVLTVATFVIGVFVGVIVKKILKLAMAIVVLIILLVVTGFLSLTLSVPTAIVIYRVFSQAPQVSTQIRDLAALLPLSSLAFIIGAVVGFWKG